MKPWDLEELTLAEVAMLLEPDEQADQAEVFSSLVRSRQEPVKQRLLRQLRR